MFNKSCVLRAQGARICRHGPEPGRRAAGLPGRGILLIFKTYPYNFVFSFDIGFKNDINLLFKIQFYRNHPERIHFLTQNKEELS